MKTSLIVLAVAVLGALAWVGVRQTTRDSAASPTEVRKIEADRVLVERWVARCLALSETRGAPAGLKLTADRSSAPASAPPLDPAQVHPAYYRVIAINNALAERRVALDTHWSDAFVRAEIATWASVLIGLLTTAMVALSATSLVAPAQDSMPEKGAWIKYSALILPAVGTALAAAIAFYEPGALLASRKWQATSAEQLHIQIGQGVWKLPCFKTADALLTDPQAALFDGWSQRFLELASRSDAKSGGDATVSTSQAPK